MEGSGAFDQGKGSTQRLSRTQNIIAVKASGSYHLLPVRVLHGWFINLPSLRHLDTPYPYLPLIQILLPF